MPAAASPEPQFPPRLDGIGHRGRLTFAAYCRHARNSRVLKSWFELPAGQPRETVIENELDTVELAECARPWGLDWFTATGERWPGCYWPDAIPGQETN